MYHSSCSSKHNDSVSKTTNSSLAPSQYLISKMMEAQVKTHSEQCQQLEIEAKELQIATLSKQHEYEQLMRMHRRQRKKVQVAEILLKKQEMENQKKKRYLEDFYNYLEEKLSANTDHFKDKLAKMEATLIAKYEAEQSNLKEGLVSVEEQLRRMEEEKATLESKKEELISVCDRRKDEECDNDKREARQRVEKMKQLKKQNYELQQMITTLGEEKKKLETSEKHFKRLLNIEEQHRRHSQIITNGIRKMYSLGLKECLYREAVNVEYSRNLPDLASIVKKRKEEKKSLQEQNIDKSRKLQQLKNEFNERVSYYSQLQSTIIAQNNHK